MAGSNAPSDEALFERFRQAGDRQALGQLFERYAVTISGLCAKMLPLNLAEEAAQEAFLAVIQHARTYRSNAPFKHWVMTITVNTCRRAARKEKQIMSRENTLRSKAVGAEPFAGAEQDAIRREELQDLEGCLQTLPADQRAALVLHYAGGLSRSAVAQALAKPEGTVASWLAGGLARLHALMRARGHAVPESIVSACLPILPVPAFAPGLQLIAAKMAAQAALPAASILKAVGLVAKIAGCLLAAVVVAFLLRTPKGGPLPVRGGAASGPAEKVAVKNDPETQLMVPLGQAGANGLAFRESADGSVAAFFDNRDGRFFLVDAAQPGKFIFSPSLDIADVAFAPDGKSYVAAGFGRNEALEHHEWPSGKLLKRMEFKTAGGANTRVFFGFDNRHTATLDGQNLTWWDLEKGTAASTRAFAVKLAPPAEKEDPLEKGATSSFCVFSEKLPDPEIEAPMPTTDSFAANNGKIFTRTYYTINFRGRKLPESRAAFAPVLNHMAVACEDCPVQALAPVNIVEMATGKILRACERKHVPVLPANCIVRTALCASPSGHWLAELCGYADEKGVNYCLAVWDTATGGEVASHEWKSGGEALGDVFDLSCSVMVLDSGELLLSGARDFFRWDWKNGQEPARAAVNAGKVQFFRKAADAAAVGIRAADGMGLYDLKTGSLTSFSRYAEPALYTLAVSADGRFFASAGKDGKTAVWDLSAGCLAGQANIHGPLPGKYASVGARLVFAPDNAGLILARGISHVRANPNWNFPHIATDIERMYERQAPLRMAYVNDTSWDIEKWDLKKGERRMLFDNGKLVSHENHWWSFAMNERFAALYTARDLRRFDLNAEKELPRIPLGDDLSQKAMMDKDISFTARLFLCPGRSELFVNGYRTLFIDLLSGQVVGNLPKNQIEEGVFSPDGKWFLGVDSQGVKMAPINNIQAAGGGLPPGFDIGFEPNGPRFAYFGKESLIVAELPAAMAKAKIWCHQLSAALVPKTEEWLACSYHTQSKVGCWSHPDYRLLAGGHHILIGGPAGAVLLDVENFNEVARFYVFPDNSWLITTPDGLFTGSPNAAKLVRLVKAGRDVTTGKDVEARRQPEEIRKRLNACISHQAKFDWKAVVPPENAAPPNKADEF